IPDQSLFFTVTLASWGFVVVAPPHPGSGFTQSPGCMDPAELADSYLNRLDDMRFVLDQILAEDDRVGSPFHRTLARRRIGMSGHSFGGLDTLRVATSDPRVRAALALAPARPDLSGGRIKIPTMIEGAELDTLAPFQTDTLAAYALLDGPRFLVEILNAGHFAFSDICAGAIFGTSDCTPGTISQDDAHHRPALWSPVPHALRRPHEALQPPAEAAGGAGRHVPGRAASVAFAPRPSPRCDPAGRVRCRRRLRGLPLRWCRTDAVRWIAYRACAAELHLRPRRARASLGPVQVCTGPSLS